MTRRDATPSLAAERAVRLLRRGPPAVDSTSLAREILATRVPSESTATRLLTTAFGRDTRLAYADGAWRLTGPGAPAAAREPDRVLLGATLARTRGRGVPPALARVVAVRLRGARPYGISSGEVRAGTGGVRLRAEILRLLDGAVPVLHDGPGTLAALERWLGAPLVAPIRLRALARERLGLRARHDLDALLARIGVRWSDSGEPLDVAAALDACLEALRRPGEPLVALRHVEGDPHDPVDWTRFAFDREMLRCVPHAPGTYRFFDARGALLYVGKSRDLARRLGSYFPEGARPPARVRRLLERLWRIEYEAAGSDLEALLREAEQIRRERPQANVQRELHPRECRAARLEALVIVEPAEPPAVLRAFLVRRGRLLGRVPIGRRGGGLRRIRRLLDDRFFAAADPAPAAGPDLDAELVARWLAEHRDRVVSFDPTDLESAEHVVERLRCFARRRHLLEPEGPPVWRR